MTSSNGFRGAPGDFPRAATSVVIAAPNVTASDQGERPGTAVPPSVAATAGTVAGGVLVIGGALVFLTAATLAVTVGGRHRNGGKRRSAHGKAPEPRGGRDRTSLSGNQPRPPHDIYPPAGSRTAARVELPAALHLAPWERAEARQEPALPPRTRPGSGSQPAAQNRGANPASSSGPMRGYNPPSRPMRQYSPPSGPTHPYDAPSGPLPQYNHPSGPLPQYSPPSGPMRQYGPPSGPMRPYGPPSGQPVQYQYGPPPGQVVQQYAAREGTVEQLDRLGRESGKLWTVDSARLANQILSTANQQAAEVRREAAERAAAARREAEDLLRRATEEAAAKIAAAEREAAEMRAAVLKLSDELTEVVTRFTANLPGYTKPLARPQADSPARSKTRAVATKPSVSPKRTPVTRTDGKQKNRQLSAARKVVAAFVTLFRIGVGA